MTGALKVVMIVYGVVLVIMGLMNMTMHDLVSGLYGIGQMPGFVLWMGSIIGALLLSIGVWVIVAGRDPLRNIYLVKLIITKAILGVVVTVYAILVGYVEFSQVGGIIILDAVFAVALLALYPWRAASLEE